MKSTICFSALLCSLSAFVAATDDNSTTILSYILGTETSSDVVSPVTTTLTFSANSIVSQVEAEATSFVTYSPTLAELFPTGALAPGKISHVSFELDDDDDDDEHVSDNVDQLDNSDAITDDEIAEMFGEVSAEGMFHLKEKFIDLFNSPKFTLNALEHPSLVPFFESAHWIDEFLGSDNEIDLMIEERCSETGDILADAIIDKDLAEAWEALRDNPGLVELEEIFTGRSPLKAKRILKASLKLMFQRKKTYPDCSAVNRPHFHGLCENKEKQRLEHKNKYNGAVFRFLRSGYLPAVTGGVALSTFTVERFLCAPGTGLFAKSERCKPIQHVAFITEAMMAAFTLYGFRNVNDYQLPFSRLVLKLKNYMKVAGIEFSQSYVITTDNKVLGLYDEMDTLEVPMKAFVTNYEMGTGEPVSLAFYPLNHHNELGVSFISRHFVDEDIVRINNPDLPSARKAEDTEEGMVYSKVMFRIDPQHLDYHLDHPSPQDLRNHFRSHVMDLFDQIFYRGRSSSAFDIESKVPSKSKSKRDSTDNDRTLVEASDIAEGKDEILKGRAWGVGIRVTFEDDPVHNLCYNDDYADYL